MNAEIYSLEPEIAVEGSSVVGRDLMAVSDAVALVEAPDGVSPVVLRRAALVVDRFGNREQRTRAALLRIVLAAEERALERALRERVKGNFEHRGRRDRAHVGRLVIGAVVGLSLGALLAVFL